MNTDYEKLQERKSDLNSEIRKLGKWINILSHGKIPYLAIKFGEDEFFIPRELVNVQKITGGAIAKTNSAIARKKKELAIINIELKYFDQNKHLFLEKKEPIKITEYVLNDLAVK